MIYTLTNPEFSDELLSEPLLEVSNRKYIPSHDKYTDIKKYCCQHRDIIWFENEVDLSTDIEHWYRFDASEQRLIEYFMAFFATSDGIIMKNISNNFDEEIQIFEVLDFFRTQGFMESVHVKMYDSILHTIVVDPTKRDQLRNAMDTVPSIRRKAKWAEKWLDCDIRFAVRLIAFAIVEHLFFCTAFAGIYFFKDRGLMPGLCMSNEFISRDESLHVEFAIHLYNNYVVNKLTQIEVNKLIFEAIEIEKEFITAALPENIIGMNKEMMHQYAEYMANYFVIQIGHTTPWTNVKCPFGFMDKIGLQTQTSFFEKRVSSYRKNTSVEVKSIDNIELSYNEDF
jgi:ribonucleotide reductase beta subunit family protein with ferritin-like domain